MSYIYDYLGNYIPITIVNAYNSYIHNFFYLNNNFFITLIYFFKDFLFNRNFFLKQFKVNNYEYFNLKYFKKISLNYFYINQKINIYGVSIGKGFSGVIKRHNFSSNYKTHGNSKSHNKPGSIGMCQDPGRVYPGKKMPGHLGNKKIFIKNSRILKINFENNIFYLKGTVPGSKNSNILIYPFSNSIHAI